MFNVGETKLMTCKTQNARVKNQETKETILKKITNGDEQYARISKHRENPIITKSTYVALRESDITYNEKLDKLYHDFINRNDEVKGFWGNYEPDNQGFIDYLKTLDDELEELYGVNTYNNDSWLEEIVNYGVWQDKTGIHCLLSVHQGGDARVNYSEAHVFDCDEENSLGLIAVDLGLSCECGSIYSDDGYNLYSDDYDGELNENGFIPTWQVIPSEENKYAGKLVCTKCKEIVIDG